MAEGWQQVGSKKPSAGSTSPVLMVSRRQLQQHKASGAGQQGAKAAGGSGTFRGVVVDKTFSGGVRYIVEYSHRPGGPKTRASFLPANVKGLEPSLGDHVNFRLAPGGPQQQQGAAVEVEVVQLRGRVVSLKVAKTGEQGFIQYKDGGSAEDKSVFFHHSVVERGTVLKVGDEVTFVMRTYDKTGQLTARAVRKAPALARAPARNVAAGGPSSLASTSQAAALARAAVPAPGRPALPVAHSTAAAAGSTAATAASAAAALPPALAALSLGAGQEDGEEDGCCIVCWEHPALAVLVPCGHMVCCARCVQLFGPGAANSACPMCREEVLHWVIPK